MQHIFTHLFFLEPRSNFDFSPFVSDLYQCTVVRLKAADIDQEVKERAISCMGQILCNLGDHLQVNPYFCILLEFLYKNDLFFLIFCF